MHRIDLKDYQIRTDLAIEATSNIDLLNKKEHYIDNIKVTNIYLDKKSSSLINKKNGNYTTIEFDDITDFNMKEKVKKVFSNELKKLLTKLKISKEASCLVLGLGNMSSTPDALGPQSVNNILVTSHLFNFTKVEDFRIFCQIYFSPSEMQISKISLELLLAH